jgi:hypothetical protein
MKEVKIRAVLSNFLSPADIAKELEIIEGVSGDRAKRAELLIKGCLQRIYEDENENRWGGVANALGLEDKS